MSRLRLPLVVFVCCLSWTALGALFGLIFHHAQGGLLLGLLLGLVYVLVGSLSAERFPLDVWQARVLENVHAPKLYEMMQALCERVDMDVPTLYYTTHPEPNAYAVGRREGGPVVVVTNGLTRHLDKDEVQAVMALMVARLATGVMPSWTVTATLAGLPLHLGVVLRRRGLDGVGNALLSLFALPAAALTWLGWNEATITAADYHAAHLAERPGALQAALSKIEAGLSEDQATAGSPATALLFAVPPLPAPAQDAPFWRRALAAFPYRSPDAAARAARLLSGPSAVLTDPPSQPAGGR